MVDSVHAEAWILDPNMAMYLMKIVPSESSLTRGVASLVVANSGNPCPMSNPMSKEVSFVRPTCAQDRGLSKSAN